MVRARKEEDGEGVGGGRLRMVESEERVDVNRDVKDVRRVSYVGGRVVGDGRGARVVRRSYSVF